MSKPTSMMNTDPVGVRAVSRRECIKHGSMIAAAGVLGTSTVRAVADDSTSPDRAESARSGPQQQEAAMPDYLLKPKKPAVEALGYRVTTDIPHGNACDVHIHRDSGGRLTIEFAADPHGDRAVLWFCFRIEKSAGRAVAANQTVRLVLRHYDNMLASADTSNLHPVIREAGGDWRRLPAPEARVLPDGRLHVSWLVEMSGSAVDVAACYPYGQDAFEKLLQTTNGRYQQDVIGVSQGGRPLVRLANDYGEAGAERVGIYMIARQHAHEVTGGWVLDGILRELADSGNRAPLVWAVPFAHIDGVVEGDYGKDSNPVDLNRAWGGRSDRHEIRVIRGDIERWRKRCRAALLLDLHSPTWSHGAGVFAFIANRHAQPAKHERCVFWTTAMEAAMGRYSRNPILAPESVRQRPVLSDAAARDRVTTAASYANNALDIAGVTLETPYGAIKGQILQRHDLMEIGRRVGRAIVDQARQLPA